MYRPDHRKVKIISSALISMSFLLIVKVIFPLPEIQELFWLAVTVVIPGFLMVISPLDPSIVAILVSAIE